MDVINHGRVRYHDRFAACLSLFASMSISQEILILNGKIQRKRKSNEIEEPRAEDVAIGIDQSDLNMLDDAGEREGERDADDDEEADEANIVPV